MLAWVFVLLAAAFFLCGPSYHTPTTRVVVLRPTFPVFFFPCPCSILSNEISLLLSPAVVNPTGTTHALGPQKGPGLMRVFFLSRLALWASFDCRLFVSLCFADDFLPYWSTPATNVVFCVLVSSTPSGHAQGMALIALVFRTLTRLSSLLSSLPPHSHLTFHLHLHLHLASPHN